MARYRIISIDNGSFGDGGDPMNRGEFDDPNAALDRAIELVDEALGRCFPSVKDAKGLMDLYTIYGDEVPMIYGEPRINFNAYDYARVKAASMFAEKFGASSPEATLPPVPEWIAKARSEVDALIANIERARTKK